jgi:FdrA protein
MSKEIFGRKLKVINIGAQTFYEALKQQGIEVVHVDWKPPAGGNVKLVKLLEKLI